MTTFSRHSIGPLGDAWVRGKLERHEIVETTAKWYKDGLRRFTADVGRDRDVRSITRTEVNEWCGRQAQLVAIATYRMRASVLRLFFAWLVEEGHLDKNPCTGMKLPRKPRTVPRGLHPEQVGAALAYAEDTRERLMMSLMVREGLRCKEVAGIDLGDVDALERTLFIRDGKGGHQREVPVTEETLSLVRAYVEEERGPRAGRLIQSRRKSVWNDGDGVKAHTVMVVVSRAMKRAGVPETGHALRHTYAYGLLEAGAPVRDIQLALGHASLVTTQIYLPRARLERLRQFVGQQEYHLEMGDKGRVSQGETKNVVGIDLYDA